jgi:hypothetical protein
MKFNAILSTVLAATMIGASITPALADDDRGKKKGHYKNGKAYGTHKSQNKSRDHDSKWTKNRSNDDRWRQDQNRRDAERWRWEREKQERARIAEQKRSREAYQRQMARERDNNYYRNDNLDRLSDQRQKTKNEWRNIAYLSGGVAILGLLKKDKTLTFAGAAGALYSLHRYEQDRKSQASIDRARASYFSRDYFVRDGQRFDRRIVTKNGDRYYQFVRR